MCDETRFVDNHIITVDLDPETERNIRHHERNAVLDDVQAIVADTYIDREQFLQRLAHLRPTD